MRNVCVVAQQTQRVVEKRNVTFSQKHDEHADVDGDDNDDRHRHVDDEQWIQRKRNKKRASFLVLSTGKM